MTEFSLPEDHPLSDDPELALILGYCLSEWDLIEYAMVLLFAGLLEVDYFQAERVFWSQQSLGARRRMLSELCKRPGVIYEEENETIRSYLSKTRTLSEKRNMLAHGVWFKDSKKRHFFMMKIGPSLIWDMLDEKKKFTKEDIKQIGEECTAFRREFVPFANHYYGAKLQKMVKERMALAETLNPGSTIRLGGGGKAEQAVEPETPPEPASKQTPIA